MLILLILKSIALFCVIGFTAHSAVEFYAFTASKFNRTYPERCFWWPALSWAAFYFLCNLP